ncbi:MAG: PAS domain S-box protein [bacterium]|nr:PAS domain S-box protein [bacterium]
MPREKDVRLFSELINRSSDCLSIIDLDTGRFIYVNDMTCAMTGYTRADLLSMGIADIDPSVTASWNPARERRIRNKHAVYIREGYIRSRRGRLIPIEIHSSLVRLPGGHYMVATARDISGRKRAEEIANRAHAQLESEVQNRTAELLRINEMLKREIAVRGRVEASLRSSEKRLRTHRRELEAKNIALREMLYQIESEKTKLGARIASNIEVVLFPILDKLKLQKSNLRHVKLLQANLERISSEFGRVVSAGRMRLTPRELEVSAMIRNGLRTKEIAALLNISLRSAEWHRYNLRRKLRVARKRVNLHELLKRY